MAADIDLLMSRREAERAMRDTCKVTRATVGTLNEATGKRPTTVSTVYTGKGRLKHPRVIAKDAEAGSQLLAMSSLEIQVPVSAAGFEAGDVVEMTSCPDRPAQVGRRFRVVAPFDGTQTTSLRYRVEVDDGRK